MAHLKLVLSGDDPNAPNAIPTLLAEQVNKMPPRFLGFLCDIGEVGNLGDLKVITVKDNRHHSIVRKAVEFYTTGNLQHGEITVRRLGSAGVMLYRKDTHEQDASISATPETRELFLEQVDLYIFCLRNVMPDLQAYLCEAICTRYPISEAEIVLLLTKLYEYPGILDQTDPALLGCLCQRITLLLNALALSRPTLLLLRSNMDTKDRFLSIVQHLDEDSIERALQVCRVDEATEAKALLATFVEKHSFNASSAQNPRQILGQPTQAQHTDVRTTSTGLLANSFVPSATPQSQSQSRKRPRSAAPSGFSTTTNVTETKERRPHPDSAMFLPKSPHTRGKKAVLRLIRPSVPGEYWSITPAGWDVLTDYIKRKFTHAGYICETEAGMIAPEPCDNCLEAGAVCEVYKPDVRHDRLGGSCARCRTASHAQCSHAEIRRTKKSFHSQ